MKCFIRQSVVRKEEYTVLLAVLVQQRGAIGEEVTKCAKDLNDVLLAIKTAGNCLVPCGAIDSLKQSLLSYGTSKT